MHSAIQRVRFVTWVSIVFFIILGSGLYFWSHKEYATKAGVTTSSPEISDNTLTTGLVGYWTFDQAHVVWSDTTSEIKDTSGNNNHGNALGSLAAGSLVIGKQGQALSFNGTSDYIQATNNIDITGTKAVSLWFKATGNITNDHVMFCASDGTNNDHLIVNLFASRIQAITDNVYRLC